MAEMLVRRSLGQIHRSSAALVDLAKSAVVSHVVEDCHYCTKTLVCHKHGSYSTLTYEETPTYMRGNPHLKKGYRPPQMTSGLCVKSLFHCNNDTFNVWSHMVGMLYFTVCQFYDNFYNLPLHDADWKDHLIVFVSLLCFQICMLLSACFHTFWCMSEKSLRFWLTLDLLGVSFGLFGIYVSGIYYSFYCNPLWHNFYISIFCVLAFLTMAAPLHPDYTNPEFWVKRMVLYSAVGVFGVVPTIHWVYLQGGWFSEFTWQFLPNVLVLYILSCLAFIFYLWMIPERWMPGYFDYIGHSHHWWHLLILLALIWWRFAGLEILTYRKNHSCEIY